MTIILTSQIDDLGNNETVLTGIVLEEDGTFTALTPSASKNAVKFATVERWLRQRIGDERFEALAKP